MSGIDVYDEGEADWPTIWQMPDEFMEAQEGAADKVSVFADDVILRSAIHCYDNCALVPEGFENIAVGFFMAYVRFIAPHLKADMSDDQIADSIREIALRSIRMVRRVMADGWFAREDTPPEARK